MRINGWFSYRAAILTAVALGAICFAGFSRRLAAQDSEVLLPEQSAAKAKQVIQQGIQALGGDAYLNVHDVTTEGRLAQFDHSGELNGFGNFLDFEIPPDKERQENLPKRNIIEVYNGDKGWTLDRGGVSEAGASEVAEFQGDSAKDLDNLLRKRIHEPGMIFRYDGTDFVDLRAVDWVEMVDSDNRTFKIAFSTSTHLPVEKTTEIRDPDTRLKTEEIEVYSNYHPIDGIQTPFQITRTRNGMKIYQVFFNKVSYNTNLSDSLFTKESLDERWGQVGKKHGKASGSGGPD